MLGGQAEWRSDLLQGTPASPNPAIMHPGDSGKANNPELAYLKKLAADLQAKIDQLETKGASALQTAKETVKDTLQSVTGGGSSGHLGVLLMGPPGSGGSGC